MKHQDVSVSVSVSSPLGHGSYPANVLLWFAVSGYSLNTVTEKTLEREREERETGGFVVETKMRPCVCKTETQKSSSSHGHDLFNSSCQVSSTSLRRPRFILLPLSRSNSNSFILAFHSHPPCNLLLVHVEIKQAS